MVVKPASAKIVDFETSFDAAPVPSTDGDVIWADVRIEYILAGLNPSVTIRVPIPWSEVDTAERRMAKALRCARELIDDACRAASSEPLASGIGAQIEDILPPVLGGVAQELGLAEPTAQPRTPRLRG